MDLLPAFSDEFGQCQICSNFLSHTHHFGKLRVCCNCYEVFAQKSYGRLFDQFSKILTLMEKAVSEEAEKSYQAGLAEGKMSPKKILNSKEKLDLLRKTKIEVSELSKENKDFLDEIEKMMIN